MSRVREVMSKKILQEAADRIEAVLTDELGPHLRFDVSQGSDDDGSVAVYMTFPSGYEVMVVPYIGDLTKDHVFDDLVWLRNQALEERGIDIFWWFINANRKMLPYFLRTEVLMEAEFDLTQTPAIYWFPNRDWDPSRSLRSTLIRAAAYRALDVWGPLAFPAIARGVGIRSASARGSLSGNLGSRRGFAVSKKKVWRVVGPAITDYDLRLDRLTDQARDAMKTRARDFAAKFGVIQSKPKMTAAQRQQQRAQDYAKRPAPQTHETVLERFIALGLPFTKKRGIRAGQVAAKLYRLRFAVDPRRKPERGLHVFAYGPGDGIDFVDQAINNEFAPP